jgi:hypothetical protein
MPGATPPAQGAPHAACLRVVRGARGVWGTVVAAAIAAVPLTGCIAPPAQRGEVAIASGASERLELAWRFGYAGALGPDQPATATVLTRLDELPEGVGKNARVGDVLLESTDVALVLAGADGTARAGTLVGAWSVRHPVDELGTMHVVAYDHAVRASSVRPGTDGPSRAAWVDVIGVVDGPAGPIEVATRYDVAPGVRGVLVHSTLRVPAEATDVQLAVGDVVGAGSSPFREADKAGGAPAALVVSGKDSGYALLAVDAPWAVVDAERGSHGIPAFAMPTPPGELSIFSRFLAVLGRSDSLAVSVVQAYDVGRGVGDVEIAAVDERGYPTPLAKGTELTLDESGSREGALAFVVPRDLRAGEAIVAQAPVGHYTVRVARTAPSEASGVEVENERLARVRVRVPAQRP